MNIKRKAKGRGSDVIKLEKYCQLRKRNSRKRTFVINKLKLHLTLKGNKFCTVDISRSFNR